MHKLDIKNKELEMLREVIQAQEMEREKLAAGLHDEIGPLLSVLKLNMSRHMKQYERDCLEIDHLDAERQFIDEIILRVRGLSHELTPHLVTKKGLVFGLRNLAKSVNNFSIQIVNQSEGVENLKTQTNLNTYRIILELLNNMMKHERISELVIQFKDQENHLEINFNHDGKGISNELVQQKMQEGNGLGLTSIQLRLLVLNAEIEYFEDIHTKIKLRIPLEYDEAYTNSHS